MHSLKAHLQKNFVIDEKSLILARVFVFFAVIWNLSNYYQNIFLLTPDLDFIPADFFSFNHSFSLNLFKINSSLIFFNSVFAFGVLFSLFFLWGKWSKFSIIGLWLINTSLRNQMDLESRAFEGLTQITLVWFLFFPDISLKTLWEKNHPSKLIGGLPVFGWFNQIACLYFFSFIHKMFNPRWVSLEALQFITVKDIFQTSFSHFLISYPNVLKALTFLALAIEALAPLFLVSCFANQRIRNVIVALFIIFHSLILIFVQVGIFTPISLALWCSLLLWKNHKDYESFETSSGILRNMMAGLIVGLCFWSNIATLKNSGERGRLFEAFNGTGFNQRWTMYAQPYHTSPVNLWIASKAVFKESPGEEWDVLNDRPAGLMVPPENDGVDYIWWAFVSKVALSPGGKTKGRTRLFPSYLCSRWNGSHERKIASVEIKIIRNLVPPYGYMTLPYPKESLLASGQCP